MESLNSKFRTFWARSVWGTFYNKKAIFCWKTKETNTFNYSKRKTFIPQSITRKGKLNYNELIQWMFHCTQCIVWLWKLKNNIQHIYTLYMFMCRLICYSWLYEYLIILILNNSVNDTVILPIWADSRNSLIPSVIHQKLWAKMSLQASQPHKWPILTTQFALRSKNYPESWCHMSTFV